MRLTQIIDRREDRYVELVTDKETAEVIRKVDEPLSEPDRGHAKRRSS